MYPNLKKYIAAAAACVAGWLAIRYLLPALMPFLLGTGLALAAEPGVRFLHHRLRLPRSAASGIGITVLFSAICVLITMIFAFLFRELGLLAGILPDLETAVREGMETLQTWLITLAGRIPGSAGTLLARNVRELFSGGSAVLERGIRYGLGLAGTLLGHVPDSALSLGTGVLSAFLISAKLPQITQWLQQRLSGGRLHRLTDAAGRMKHTVLLWLLAQMKLMGITCLILTAGFLILGIPHGILWALAVSAVDAFPILGTGTVLVPWSAVCLLRHNTPWAVGLLGIYAAAAVTRSVLEPRFVGRQLGLDPLLTLFAIYAGLRLWGFAGMVLMPLAMMAAVRMLSGERGLADSP